MFDIPVPAVILALTQYRQTTRDNQRAQALFCPAQQLLRPPLGIHIILKELVERFYG
jgi:hypothetical protein